MTARCFTDCKTAFLSRADYVWKIGQEQKKKIKDKVMLLRNFRFFQSLKSSTIEKIIKLMTHVKYKRNDVVYQYGSSVEDSGVYFIMSGEFEMSTYRLIETLPDYEEMKFKEKVDHLQSSAKIPIHRIT